LTKVQVPFLRTYPENVEDLPAAITAVAFTEEDPVEPKHLENLVIIAEKHVPLRQTSKLMTMDNTSMDLPKNKKNQDTNKSMSSTPSAADFLGNNMEGFGAFGQMAMMMLQMAQQQRNQTQGTSETKISITPKKKKELEDGNHKANKDPAVVASCSGFQPQGRNLALLDAKKEDGTSQPEKAEDKTTLKRHLQSLKKKPSQLWCREVSRDKKSKRTTTKKERDSKRQRQRLKPKQKGSLL